MKRNVGILSAKILLSICCVCFSTAEAQILKRLERKIQQKTEEVIDKTIDKTIDKAGGSIEKGKNGKGKHDEKNVEQTTTFPHPDASAAPVIGAGKTASADSVLLFQRYEQFDFIPGDQILAIDDFSQDDTGQPPMKWNFNGNAEIVRLAGSTQHWVEIKGEYDVFHPDFITSLPINFTLEFDLAVGPEHDDDGFKLLFLNRDEGFRYRTSDPFVTGETYHPHGFLELSMRPKANYKSDRGDFSYQYYYAEGATRVSNRNDNVPAFSVAHNPKVRISIWRQNQRLRLYVNETKVWDIPRAFAAGLEYNTLFFKTSEGTHPYYIADLRLAQGRPDNRQKFVTEGKFSTTGIYFDSNSASIRPESYPVLKEVAKLLQEDPQPEILIVGHTDADGAVGFNLQLSKARAAAVREKLIELFGVDGSRLSIDGKGAGEPVASNDSAEGRAENRRVEFVKK